MPGKTGTLGIGAGQIHVWIPAHRGLEGKEGLSLKGSVISAMPFSHFPTASSCRGSGRDGSDSAGRFCPDEEVIAAQTKTELAMVFTGSAFPPLSEALRNRTTSGFTLKHEREMTKRRLWSLMGMLPSGASPYFPQGASYLEEEKPSRLPPFSG